MKGRPHNEVGHPRPFNGAVAPLYRPSDVSLSKRSPVREKLFTEKLIDKFFNTLYTNAMIEIDGLKFYPIRLAKVHPLLDQFALQVAKELGIHRVPYGFYSVNLSPITPPGGIVGGIAHKHNGNYIIGINEELLDLSINSAMLTETIAHESKHVQQMKDNRLELVSIGRNRELIKWEGETQDYSRVPYKDRPFEKEALSYGRNKAFKLP